MSYSVNTDLELLTFLKAGSQAAFAELYSRYKDPLYFHAGRMLGDDDEARDMVQDVFAAIWSKRETLVIPTAVDAYLYGSIRNRILNFIAHQKVITRYTDSIDAYVEKGAFITDDLVREKELLKIIQKEISLLPPKMREIFELSRNEELSHKQIAERLSISEQTVKKQVQKALRILRFKIRLSLFFSFFV